MTIDNSRISGARPAPALENNGHRNITLLNFYCRQLASRPRSYSKRVFIRPVHHPPPRSDSIREPHHSCFALLSSSVWRVPPPTGREGRFGAKRNFRTGRFGDFCNKQSRPRQIGGCGAFAVYGTHVRPTLTRTYVYYYYITLLSLLLLFLLSLTPGMHAERWKKMWVPLFERRDRTIWNRNRPRSKIDFACFDVIYCTTITRVEAYLCCNKGSDFRRFPARNTRLTASVFVVFLFFFFLRRHI